MPKSAKKRREKAADFSKAKLKLGKGKQVASNVIDTSFKARSITLPSQSITLKRSDSEPRTKRKHAFDDLVLHTKHYNASVRKDAILEFRELFDSRLDALQSHFGPLINACVRLFSDEDANVRKTLAGFLSWVMPQIPQDIFIPHAPVVLLFLTSAQTHIFPEIRIDAICFLDIFLEYSPRVVLDGWNRDHNSHGRRILDGYLSTLNAGTKFADGEGPVAASVASVTLSPSSKLTVVQSLSTFLNHALSSLHHAIPYPSDDGGTLHGWYLASLFETSDAYHAFEGLLHPNSKPVFHWKEEIHPEGEGIFAHSYIPDILENGTCKGFSDLQGYIDLSEESEAYSGKNLKGRLAQVLHSTILTTLLDCAPAVFSPSASPSETEVQLVLSVVKMSHCLYGSILQSDSEEDDIIRPIANNLATLLTYMAPYFPFKPTGSRDIKIEQVFYDLNLIFCELSSLLNLSTARHGARRGDARQNSLSALSREALIAQRERVSAYVNMLLRGEPLDVTQVGKPLTPSAYTSLLPTIWALLGSGRSYCEISKDTLQTVLQHAVNTSSKSALKRPTVEFVSRLCLLGTERSRAAVRSGLDKDVFEDPKLKSWITHLPKVLWELGSNNLPTTEVILRFLIRMLQRRSRLVDDKTLASLRSKMVPYFLINHAVRGQVIGPYQKLPTPLRRLAVDLVYTLCLIEHDFELERDTSLILAVHHAVASTDEKQYWDQLCRCRDELSTARTNQEA